MARSAATVSPFLTEEFVCREAHITSSRRFISVRAAAFALKSPSCAATRLIFPSLGSPFPITPVAAEGIGHGKGSVIFVELPFLDLEDVEMAFPQPLQMADVRLADLVALPERRPLELASADFGDIVGKNGPYGIFDVDYPLAHIRS